MRRLWALMLAWCIAPPLFAHDFWIEPTNFLPEPGQIVGLRLRVGQGLVGGA